MKKIVRRMIPLITFELPLQYEHIERLFVNIQHNEQQRYSGWSAQATLKKATSHYWYQYVLIHFSLIYGLGCLISLLISVFSNNAISSSLTMFPVCGVIIFFILMITHYTPFYYNDFLPRLNTIAATHEGSHLAQLEKCKQAQYSNLALVLIFYVWDKGGELNPSLTLDQLSKLLMKLYGVDNGSIKKNLELIFNKRPNLSPRKQKEIEKGFDEAYSFFEDIDYKKGTCLLKELEIKIKRP